MPRATTAVAWVVAPTMSEDEARDAVTDAAGTGVTVSAIFEVTPPADALRVEVPARQL